ncbi:LPS export ABC transporter periplasmic protein LptC [Thiotrichales bacterium 19S3-7]|nr:LPS export ABC transporter periplasmic protein LptC [Thiotrichales bacterium 19S3-7]MCF6801412.1 LPS export ABC transporter periplasmic protein LptC [Thiotrichales bacterium 19S3-11]
MFFSKRSVASTLVLAALVGFTSWLTIESSGTFHSKQKLPNDFVTNVATDTTLYQMNEKGSLRYKAFATHLEKFANDDVDMTQVNMTMEPQKPGDLPWNIVSNHGYLSDKNNKLKLWGNVVITRPGNGKDKPPLKITTSLLYVYPNKDYAETDKFVKMEQVGSKNVITGVGMKAHMHPEKIQLLSKVKSYYESSKNDR